MLIKGYLLDYYFFYLITVVVQTNLHAPRLITRDHEVNGQVNL